jgi:hypothetical protein
MSLRELARRTGGMYFDSVVNYEKIAENIQRLTGSYYVLGYYIDEKWDGRFHKLKIEVQRKGCKVFGQGGYFSPKPYPEYTELEKTLHLIDLALNPNPLYQAPKHFPMIALPFSLEAKPNLMVIGMIQKEDVESFFKNKAEIIAFIFDKQGNLVKMQTGKATGYNAIQDKAYLCSFISVPPGSYDCRVVIIESETGQGAVASAAVIVPESRSEGIELFPPLLLRSQEGASYIRALGEKKEKGAISLTDVYPYDLAKYVPVLEAFDRGITRIRIVVRCLRKDISGPDTELSIKLQNKAKGESISLSFSIFSRTKHANYEIISLEASTEELSPGDYSLYIKGKDPASNSVSQVDLAFSVK